MAGRAIIVVVCLAALAAVVVRGAFVDAYLVKNPAMVAAIWPGHPTVLLEKGLAEVGELAAAGRPVNPATVQRMLAIGAKAPLAPEPYLVRGVQAREAGDEALALRAFLEARQRNPRSVAARYFLADHYLRAGQTRRGLAEISALTRLVPESLGGIVPQLAAFARMPDSLEQVRILLRDQPQLEPRLLYELAANPGAANLAISLWSGGTDDPDRAWQQRLVNSLVSAGRFDEAGKTWGRFNPGARQEGGLVDPRFEADDLAPFGWTLATGPAGVAEPEGGGRLHILYYGRDDLILASQLLLLKPGPYRLAMRVDATGPIPKSLSWVVRCLPASRDLAAVSLASAKGGVLAVDFTVPGQGCAAQRLELAGTAPDLPEQADLTIAGLRLEGRGS